MKQIPPVATPAPIRFSCHDALRPGCPCLRTSAPYSTRIGEAALRDAAAGTNGDPIPRPISIAVHFPNRTRLRADGDCNARSEAYLSRLRREVALLAPLFDRDRQIDQIHLLNRPLAHLTPEQVRELLDALARHFAFAVTGAPLRLAELDPAAGSLADIEALAAAGISHAAQFIDLMPESGDAPASLDSHLALMAACRGHGISHVHAHLSGGDRADIDSCMRALEALLEARPDRITLHQTRPLDGADAGPSGSSDSASCDALDRRTGFFSRLTQAGYQHLGLCCFALPEDELVLARRRNALHCDLLGYSARPDSDLVGIGVGATTQVGATVCQNLRELPLWEEAIDASRLPIWRGACMSPDDQLRAEVIQQLVCRGEIDFGEISRHHSISFEERFSRALDRLDALAGEGLLERGAQGVRATDSGLHQLHRLTACFDEREGEAVQVALRRPHRAL